MKKLTGIILALAFLLGTSGPALAGQESAQEQASYGERLVQQAAKQLAGGIDAGQLQRPAILADVTAGGETDIFYYGFYDAYYTTYDEGEEKGMADYAAGRAYNVDNPYGAVLTDEEADALWDNGSYEQGYNHGLAQGYAQGYYWGYYDVYWQQSYDKAYPLGWADYVNGRYGDQNPYFNIDYYNLEGADYVYASGINSGYWDGYYEAQWQEYMKQEAQRRQEEVVAVGGTAGQINVMLNGACIAFPDAVPEIAGGRTMVPVRAIIDALGANLDYNQEENLITITKDGVSVSLTIGASWAAVEKNGEQARVTLDTPSYIRNDRAYVPLRFLSETLGLDVHWDDTYNLVVLLDKAELIRQINIRMPIANLWMQTQGKLLAQPVEVTSKGKATVEMIDTISGNQVYEIPGSMKMQAGDGGMILNGAVDLTALYQVFKATYSQSGWYSEEEVTSILEYVKPLLKEQTFAVKVTPQGDIYLQLPLMSWLMGQLGSGEEIREDAWYLLGQMDTTMLVPEGYTVGQLLYNSTVQGYTYPFYYYDTLMASTGIMESLFGDQRFTKSGSTYRMALDADALINALGLEDDEYGMVEYYKNLIRQFDFTLSFTEDGRYEIGLEMKASTNYYTNVTDMNLEMTEKGSASGGKARIFYQQRNSMNLTVECETTIQKAKKEFDYSIPEGAQLIDLTDTGAW